MECTEARNWLFLKIDGELSESQSMELNLHLTRCASCSREYMLLTLPRRIAPEIPSYTPSPFFYRTLKMRIEGEAQRTAARQAFLSLARQMVPTLAGITLALLSVFAYLQLRGPEPELYRVYTRAFISEDQSHRMLAARQGDITNESVLNAIAERESNRRQSHDLK